MSKLGSLEEVWRRSLDLNLRYYGALGRLTADYLKELVTAVSESQTPQPENGGSSTSQSGPSTPQVEVSQPSRSAKHAGAMVLEGEAGTSAVGVFLVENHLTRDISARVVASAFFAENGHEVRPVMLFDPETIALRSGEQSLVRVSTVIDETLDPEVRYSGHFTIPELVGTRIPVVLRRGLSQHKASAEMVERAAAGDDLKSKKKKRGGGTRSRRTKRSSDVSTRTS